MTFKDPKVAFSRTNSRQKFTAWTVLQQHLISISVITVQFLLVSTYGLLTQPNKNTPVAQSI